MKTKDYNKFKALNANRPILQVNLRKIKESIQKNGLIPGRPILVNSKMEIIDGQHRFTVLKELGMEVEYEILEGNSVQQAIILNANQTQWKIGDYVHCYASQNIDCYRKLVKFEEKYHLGISNSIDVFMKTNSTPSKIIRQGLGFEINPKADEIAEYILSCSSVPFYKTNKFCRSIMVLFRKANESQLKFIKDNILVVPQCSTDQQYLTVYENLINRNKHVSNRVSLA